MYIIEPLDFKQIVEIINSKIEEEKKKINNYERLSVLQELMIDINNKEIEYKNKMINIMIKSDYV